MKTNTKHWASITAGILTLTGHASATAIGSEKYTYDASGNITEKSIDGVVTRMNYDSSNRLIGLTSSNSGSETTTHDAAGRPIAQINSNGKNSRETHYGYGDKVLSSKTPEATAEFYYNAEGQLIAKSTAGHISSYAWDGNVLAAEGDQVFTNEDHLSGGTPILAAGKDVVVSDYLGNTLSSGAQSYTSTAYGEGLEKARFTGKPYIKELSSYVFHHRLYSPQENRWTVADPTGFPDGTNRYAYVNGDVVNKIDPLGLAEGDWSDWDRTELPPFPSKDGTFKAPTLPLSNRDYVEVYSTRWQHKSYSEIASQIASSGQKLKGSFNYTRTEAYNINVGGDLFAGGASVSASIGSSIGSSAGSSNEYDVTAGKNQNIMVHGMVSRADHYKIKALYVVYNGAWERTSHEPQWVDNLKIDYLYKNKTGIEYSEQHEL